MKIAIVGIGMGNPDTLTRQVQEKLKSAQVIIGAKRIVESIPRECLGRRISLVNCNEIYQAILENSTCELICVAMSGDSGFFSGTTSLLPLLSAYEVEIMCGITSVQYFAAKIARSWNNVKLVSAHGTDCNILGEVMQSQETFFLTGGKITPEQIIDELCNWGLADAMVFVGERLSYAKERIIQGHAEELRGEVFDALSVVWVIRKAFTKEHTYYGSIQDDAFIRGKVPMTKRDVRGAILSRLAPNEEDVIFDIGAGTGSVSIELALMKPRAKIYAVESNPEACTLIGENREKFSAYNIRLKEGLAPEALENLPIPDRVFIGGSKGNLREIIQFVLQKNKNAKIVISAVTLETLSEALRIMGECNIRDAEYVQISVTETRQVGQYHMLLPQSPIFLISGGGND